MHKFHLDISRTAAPELARQKFTVEPSASASRKLNGCDTFMLLHVAYDVCLALISETIARING